MVLVIKESEIRFDVWILGNFESSWMKFRAG
jgi:hypothetical protein